VRPDTEDERAPPSPPRPRQMPLRDYLAGPRPCSAAAPGLTGWQNDDDDAGASAAPPCSPAAEPPALARCSATVCSSFSLARRGRGGACGGQGGEWEKLNWTTFFVYTFLLTIQLWRLGSVVERGTADVQRHVQRHLEVMGSIPIVSFCTPFCRCVGVVAKEDMGGGRGRGEGHTPSGPGEAYTAASSPDSGRDISLAACVSGRASCCSSVVCQGLECIKAFFAAPPPPPPTPPPPSPHTKSTPAALRPGPGPRPRGRGGAAGPGAHTTTAAARRG
jgi:hypothetical protein